MDLFLILFLILLNGIFAMSEIAIVSSRKARLQNLVEDGESGASAALQLHNAPSNFLSTIQIGITSTSILSGAFGENSLATPLAQWLSQYALIAPYSKGVALTIVVIGITYFSIIVGELVPKRLALLNPERVASVIGKPMIWFARATKPLIWLLSTTSDLILRLLRAKQGGEPPVTNAEIKVLMEQGAEAGIFHESEQEIVANVLRLDEQRVSAIMTPRKNMHYLDLEDSEELIQQGIATSAYSRVVVCRGGLEHILGILQIHDLLKHPNHQLKHTIETILRPPLYVPETVTTTQLLEQFRKSRMQFGLIVDEYGELQGLVTLTDVLISIVGDLPAENSEPDDEAVQRADGSWLIDGSINIERFKALLEQNTLPGEEENRFHTLAGFVLQKLGRIPQVADYFEMDGLRFEIVDMDRNRIDKILVSITSPTLPNSHETKKLDGLLDDSLHH